ncbi:MAG: creatininase family protein [Candidatus Abyssobacteria bacterium SURF_17]|uniref:Creatininase family protein n=1 Tax=Candidatus Abyssobacteria bacterium SURF_17 TaxID=2093361 RepID=A0A419EW36_9BACT|nr:MAG: creatininase family protein [Candidatus Abyssubacteria bacterium SURF_17]
MTQPTVWLDRMTSPQVKEAINNGYRTVLLAVGSTEQHGPHLPLGTDSFIGDTLVEQVARQLGKTLVAPTIRVGCSEHHMAFAGTMTLREEVLEEVLADCCRSLARHGFRAVVLIPVHGGNVEAVEKTAQRLARESLSARVPAQLDNSAYITAMVEVGGKYDVTPGEAGTHAGHCETSVVLAYHPELVDMSKAARGKVDLGFDSEERLHEEGMHSLSPIGILGDATRSSAEAGKDYMECMVSRIADQIRETMAGLLT